MKKFLLIGLIGAMLSGCATKLTDEQIKSADYGLEPTNYEQVVKNYYEIVAKDPDSLKYKEITKPQKVWLRDFGEYKFGYLTCVILNGKNSYGAYVGYQQRALLIKNDKVIHQIENVTQFNRMWNTSFCQ